MGEAPETVPPFPAELVGVYSCHGKKPSNQEEEFSSLSKTNQDRGCVVFPFATHPRQAVFGVFDGHGRSGDVVSQAAMDEVLRLLDTELRGATPESVDFGAAMKRAFVGAHRHLRAAHGEHAHDSGTTAVVVLQRDDRLWVANAGDSRAVLCRAARADGDARVTSLVALPLSRDHNPNAVVERERIVRAGGFVSEPPEPGLSARVWADAELTEFGLAMSRSLGDFDLHDALGGEGVIAEPEVAEYALAPGCDEFIIVASDGVWEFLSSSDAVRMCADHLVFADEPADAACRALIAEAANRWATIEGDYRDDITAIVARVNVFDELEAREHEVSPAVLETVPESEATSDSAELDANTHPVAMVA